MKLYHLIDPAEWQKAVDSGTYHPPSLRDEGFVHMSFEHQLESTANRHYAAATRLVAVVFDPDVFAADLVVEDTSGHGEFPHVYRAIVPAEAEAVVELRNTENGWLLDS